VAFSVIERWELVMPGAHHASATLVRLPEGRLRSRRQTTVKSRLLAVLGVFTALDLVAPQMLVG
jgi:hypothetical protein